MKKVFSFLILSLIAIDSMFAQSIFSVIHLNDKEDIQHGLAKSIEWTFTDLRSGRSVTQGSLRLNHNNQVMYDFENDFYTDDWQNTIITNFNTITGLVESRMYNIQNSEGFILETENFNYDKNNFLSEIIHLDKDMKIFQHTLIKNNERGFPVELATYNEEGKLVGDIERAEYLYEENKYISKIYSSDGELLASNKEILNPSNNYKFKNSDLEYNDSGDLIKCSISEDGYILYTYKYDRLSNWNEYRVYDVSMSNEGKERKNLITIYKRNIKYWEK